MQPKGVLLQLPIEDGIPYLLLFICRAELHTESGDSPMEKDLWEKRLALYDGLIGTNPEIERKGKTMPYTSVNGHMFSQLNKAGEIGLRLSEEDREHFVQEYGTEVFRSYGAVMKGYVLVPDVLVNDPETFGHWLRAAWEYAKSLKPKGSTSKK